MDIATVARAIQTTLKNDADVTAQVPANMIFRGLGKTIPKSRLPKSINIIQIGIGETPEEGEEESEWAAGKEWVWVHHLLNIAAILTIDDTQDDEDGEDLESTVDRVIRKALTTGYTLGGVVSYLTLGKTLFFTHPDKERTYGVRLAIDAVTHEQTDVR